ncbi:hypothetical protein NQ314_011460 [Rhamnusium bicolor]|uniref:PCNA-associated factor histone-like domain-containing protein n=1 Tax=Rhamnusium bicolor TaxID=1586634 RepID=A0AAV8XHK5_9CUCU|nr:hypothetical protein NQ314_011460 [Rhamnusium bicolor]
MVRTSAGVRMWGNHPRKVAVEGAVLFQQQVEEQVVKEARLPPIPHCEAPSWQKPITNFFNAEASSLKHDTQIVEKTEENIKDNRIETENKSDGESNKLIYKSDNSDINAEINIKVDNADIEKENKEDFNSINNDEPQRKKAKEGR